MKKSVLSATAASFVALLLLSACGGTPPEPSTSASTSTEPTASESADPASLTGQVDWWGWTGLTTIEPLIAEFNKTYPGIKVNYKFIEYADYAATLRPGLSAGAGSGPDVFTLQAGGIAQQFGPLAQPLEPLLEKTLGSDWSDKITASYQTLVVDGSLRAIPMGSTSAGTLLVNSSMLASYGVELPTATTTLDEWKALCAPIVADGKTCVGQGGQEGWQNTDLFQAVADSYAPGRFRDAVDGKVEWTDPDLVQALTLIQDFFKDGFFQDGAIGATVGDVINGFGAQKVAMTLVGTWGANTYLESGITGLESGAGVAEPTAFTVLLTQFPDVAGRGNQVPLFGDPDGLSISPKSDDPEAAAVFATWLGLSEPGQQYLADGLTMITSLQSVTPQPQGLVDAGVQEPSLKAITAAVHSSPERRQIDYPELVTAIADALQSVGTGASPADAAAQLQTVSASIDRG